MHDVFSPRGPLQSPRKVKRASRILRSKFTRSDMTLSNDNVILEGDTYLVPVRRAKSVQLSHQSEQEPYRRLMNEFNVLLFLFPDFPKAMMKTLVFREKGNTRVVANFLKSRGWGNNDPLILTLSSKIHLHVELEYFWGLDKPEFRKKLSKQPCGSFFVSFKKPKTYLLCFVNKSGQIDQNRIASPRVEANDHSTIFINNPLKRPDSIPIQDILLLN